MVLPVPGIGRDEDPPPPSRPRAAIAKAPALPWLAHFWLRAHAPKEAHSLAPTRPAAAALDVPAAAEAAPPVVLALGHRKCERHRAGVLGAAAAAPL